MEGIQHITQHIREYPEGFVRHLLGGLTEYADVIGLVVALPDNLGVYEKFELIIAAMSVFTPDSGFERGKGWLNCSNPINPVILLEWTNFYGSVVH